MKKDVVFLCGYFEKEFEKEVIDKTITSVENAANIFQFRLIQGFLEQCNLKVISAPFIGAWPNAYKDFFYKRWWSEKIEYLDFVNVWGYRNISRSFNMKKKMQEYLKSNHVDFIIIYSPHTPFIETALYAKKIQPSIKICMIVPDLPQYMNLNVRRSKIYDFFKAIDIKKFNQIRKNVDYYVVLTKYMAESLNIKDDRYIVIEGIADKHLVRNNGRQRNNNIKRIVFAGKLNESFGVRNLVESFKLIKDEDIRLEICGGGELEEYVKNQEKKDSRIKYYGLVSSEEANNILVNADILVNPRINNSEYTKYSFPSKNVEYLLTGNTVIAYMLDGIPDIYKQFLLIPKDETIAALADTLIYALHEDKQFAFNRSQKAIEYLTTERSEKAVTEKILNMMNGKSM